MKITMHNFRCYKHSTYTFEQGKFNLIRGDSGVGKSTLFQGIFWCLYGQLRNVNNHANQRAEVWVLLEYGGHCIFRRRNPTTFTYTSPAGITYEGDVAQAEVNKVFVTPELWPCVCSVAQGEYNPIISAAGAARMSILNSIAFGDDDPRHYYERIGAELQRVESEVPGNTRQFENLSSNYQAFITQYQDQMYPPLDPPQQQEMERKLQQMNVEIENLSKLLLESTSRESARSTLEISIAKIGEQLKILPQFGNEELRARQREISQQRERAILEQQLQRIISSAPRNHFEQKPPRYNLSQLTEIHHKEQLHQQEVRKATKLGLEYRSEVIQNALIEVEAQIEEQKLFAEYQYHQQLKSQHQSIISKLKPEVSMSTVEEARRRLHQYEVSCNSIPCPNCGTHLRYIGGTLTSTQSPPNTTREAILHEIVEAEKQLAYQQQVMELERLILQHPEPSVREGCVKRDIAALQQKREALRQIYHVEKPEITSEEVKRIIEWWKYQDALQQAEDALRQYPEKKECDSAQLERDIMLQAKRTTLQQQLGQLELQLSKLPAMRETSAQITAKREDLQQQKAELQKCLQGSKLSRQALSQYEQLEMLATSLQRSHNRSHNLRRLLEEAHRLECETLVGVVEQINSFIRQWAPILFEGQLSLSLSLFRPLKSRPGEKQQLTLTITHQQGNDAEFSSCSGGEKERINLLITLALHQQRGSGILILDETLACLDARNRDACLELIRSVVSNTTVLVVNHEICEAAFDNLISVGGTAAEITSPEV